MANEYKFPYTFQDLTAEEAEMVKFFGSRKLTRIASTNYCVPKRMEKYATSLYNFQPRQSDIWLLGYPRSGTTMMQEVLYLLGTDFDYTKAASMRVNDRFPYLEHVLMRSDNTEEVYERICKEKKTKLTPEEEDSIPPHIFLANTREKRFIKSHLSFNLLNPQLLNTGCKVVFIVRNIKDCLISNYYYPTSENMSTRNGDNTHVMFQLYKNNLTAWGSYFEGLKEAWLNRHNKNLLILFYEDVNEDKRAAIAKIAKFLEKDITEDQLNKLVDHISVDNFKKNKSVNNDYLVEKGILVKEGEFTFIRQGKSGGWRDAFSKESNEEMNAWIREQLSQIPDFEMPECWKKAMDME